MFTLEQRYQILTFLNQALMRTDAMKSQYSEYQGDFYRFDGTLTPTEYQKNRPVPLTFHRDDIWKRLDAIDAESEYLVKQVLEVVEGLQKLEGAITSERSSPNAALIKADVLEWAGSRTSGMFAQRDDFIEKLRYFLNLPPSPNDWGGGGLIRS
jgi:hypothetical protein